MPPLETLTHSAVPLVVETRITKLRSVVVAIAVGRDQERRAGAAGRPFHIGVHAGRQRAVRIRDVEFDGEGSGFGVERVTGPGHRAGEGAARVRRDFEGHRRAAPWKVHNIPDVWGVSR